MHKVTRRFYQLPRIMLIPKSQLSSECSTTRFFQINGWSGQDMLSCWKVFFQLLGQRCNFLGQATQRMIGSLSCVPQTSIPCPTVPQISNPLPQIFERTPLFPPKVVVGGRAHMEELRWHTPQHFVLTKELTNLEKPKSQKHP